MRGRLDQLRDLVQYYQAGNEFIHDDEHMSQSMITDNDDNQSGVRLMYLQYMHPCNIHLCSLCIKCIDSFIYASMQSVHRVAYASNALTAQCIDRLMNLMHL